MKSFLWMALGAIVAIGGLYVLIFGMIFPGVMIFLFIVGIFVAATIVTIIIVKTVKRLLLSLNRPYHPH